MNAASDPGDSMSQGAAPVSAAAERARERLREEIERVRIGVEEMLAEQGGEAGGTGRSSRLDRLEERMLRLEGRLDQAEQDRRYAEWRIHRNVELMLDGVLRDMRAIADRLERLPFPTR